MIAPKVGNTYRYDGTAFQAATPKIFTGGVWRVIGNRPWTPANLGSDLVLWLDAADESTLQLRDGQYVEQWSDKSGQGNHVYQDTATEQPTYSNGKVTFAEDDNSSAARLRGAFTINNPFTIININELKATSGSNYTFYDGYDQRSFWVHQANKHPGAYDVEFGGSRVSFDEGGLPASVIGAVRVAEEGDVWFNETLKGSATWNAQLDGLTLGNLRGSSPAGGGSYVLWGSAKGYLIIQRRVSDRELRILNGWAAHKYGLAHKLPNDHPYKYNPPTE